MSTEEFIQKIKEKYPNIQFDFSKTKYIGYKNNITITCKKHGDIISTPDRLLYKNLKYGCPKCAYELKDKGTMKLEAFIEKANKVHNGKYDYSEVEYKTTHEKVCIICPEHGEFWQDPANHLRGSGCPKCKFKKLKECQIKDNNWFIEKAKEIHGDKYDYSKVNYTGALNKVIIICKKHGEFEQQAESHLQGCGCPQCNLNKEQNKLFKVIFEKFPSLEVVQEYSPIWLGKQRIDIAIPSLNIGIEYDGRQHFIPIEKFGGELEFQKTIKRDKTKNELCKTNNFKLFRLRYDYSEDNLNDVIQYIKNWNNE